VEIRGIEAVATLVAAGEVGKVLVMEKWVSTESTRSNNGGPPHPSV
jgi:hypothetical protein